MNGRKEGRMDGYCGIFETMWSLWLLSRSGGRGSGEGMSDELWLAVGGKGSRTRVGEEPRTTRGL